MARFAFFAPRAFRLVTRFSLSTAALVAAFGLVTAAPHAQAQSPLIGAPATATVGGNWLQQSPATSPSARYYSTTAYDAATGTVVLFGGQGSSPHLGDTWSYNGTTWTQQSPATSPPARSGATMAYNAATGTVVLFGGNGSSNYLSDTWTYNGTTWTQQSPATSPPARGGATMAYDAATGTVVLFGGIGSSGILGDTWTYNGTTWTQQQPATSPPARYASTTAYDAATGTVVLFGGYGSTYLADTWTYNGTTWTQQMPATSPPAREYSTMAYDAATGTVVLFGGYSNSGYLADTWTYNGTTWTQQSPATSPPGRYGPTMAYDAATATVVLFGGSGNSGNLADTWTYAAGAFTAPTTNVGAAAAQTPVYFNITATGTVGTPQVLTQGAANLDFTLGSTATTCTGSTVGVCTVYVAFTPKAPGQRLGAVNLTSSAGTVIATAYISGTGTGPLATLSPGLISTVAGNGTTCATPTASPACGDGTAATSAELYFSQGGAVDGAGNLYLADQNNQRIRKVTAATGLISTVAGNGTAAFSGDGGAATAASLSYPLSVAVDGAGNLYIADYENNRIRKVTSATGFISTVAGNGNQGYMASQDTGTTAATAAALNLPYAVAVDGAGNLYIVDYNNERIRKVTAATGFISTVAGNGGNGGYTASQDTGTTAATAASLNDPQGVVVDGAGNLYIADSDNQRIRKVTAATGFISTVAGNGAQGYTASQDTGTTAATAASLGYPTGVAVDGAGNLYIADSGNQRIRKVTAATGFISTVAGDGGNGGYTASQDTGTTAATAASLFDPTSVTVDGAGNLYIADVQNERIRKVSVTGDIVFSTATAAGTSDTTDGTKTLAVNNIGNLPLVFTSQVETGSSFVLGNPMTGGCVSNGTIVAGGSCLVGATFVPVAGSTGVQGGYVTLTDNSLNVSGSVQTVLLEGTTTAGAATVTVLNAIAAQGATSATLTYQYGYSGTAADLGAVTVTVNGSATGVGTPACSGKASHKSCTVAYNPSSLALGSYTIAVAVAADATNGYTAASGTGTLSITATGMALPHPGFAAARPVTFAAPIGTATEPAIFPSGVLLTQPAAAAAEPADPTAACTPEAQAAATKRGNATAACAQ